MEEKQQGRRELRRKRRRRNQAAAYITVILFVILLALGVVFGVNHITDTARKQEEEQQEMVDAMLGTEEAIVVPTEPAETVAELTAEQKLEQKVDAIINSMSLEHKVAGLFIVTPESITGVTNAVQAGDGTREALSKYAVGGIVYFAKNIKSEEQIKEMLDNTALYSAYPLFLAVDEEGGSVSRVAEAGIAPKVDAAGVIGQTGDANNAYLAGNTIGDYLFRLGFNLDFAPVADLNNVEGSALGDRAYGVEAATAASYVVAAMQGLTAQKVTACLKHFPGIGCTASDTHEGMATTDRTLEEFQANEFAVFQAGIDAGADMIMVGHLSAPALTGDNTPCSMSTVVVTDILRNEMNFKGVIITDALNMSAISEYYSSEQATVMALKAGCDMILMPENFEEAYNGVLQAVQNGTISEERINDSLKRIYRIKYADEIE